MAATKNRNRHPKNPSFLPGFLGSLFGTPYKSTAKVLRKTLHHWFHRWGPTATFHQLPWSQHSTWNDGIFDEGANFSGNVVPTFSYKKHIVGWLIDVFFRGIQVVLCLVKSIHSIASLKKKTNHVPKSKVFFLASCPDVPLNSKGNIWVRR